MRLQIEKIRREAEARGTLEAEAGTGEQGLATIDAKEVGGMMPGDGMERGIMRENTMQEAEGQAGEETRMLSSAY